MNSFYINENDNINSKNIEINIELQERIKRCNEDFQKVSKVIKKMDNKFKKMEVLYKNMNNQYYRYLKKKNNPTKYAYVTIIFCDSKYISSILVAGNYLKNIIKTDYDIICLVQDKPYYEVDISGNSYLKFPGLNNNEIDDIKKIYDVVIGIDLLRVNITERSNWNLLPRYSKLPYYCTKLLVLGLIEYSKLIYFDSTALIYKNVDYLFENYNKSTYRLDYNEVLHGLKRGLVGNFYLFIPKIYYIYKGVDILNNYQSIFGNRITCFTKDEDIIYYSIYPYWNDQLLDANLFKTNFKRIPYIESDKKKYEYSVELYMGLKPFLYPNSDDILERDMYNNNNDCYYQWDLSAKNLLMYYPFFSKYFEFIKTFRNTDF
jgi:alpha-N-acetylglucosamine transferase